MNWYLVLGITAGVLQIVSVVPYILDILHGKTRPNVVTYIVWSILHVMATLAQFSAGASWSVIIMLVVTFNCILIVVLCFRGYGYKKYGKIDFACFFIAVISIVVWQITDQPVLAIILAFSADFFAIIPTIVKTYREPDSELIFSWFLSASAALFAVFSTTKIDLANLLFPVYYVISDSSVAILAYLGQKKGRQK